MNIEKLLDRHLRKYILYLIWQGSLGKQNFLKDTWRGFVREKLQLADSLEWTAQ